MCKLSEAKCFSTNTSTPCCGCYVHKKYMLLDLGTARQCLIYESAKVFTTTSNTTTTAEAGWSHVREICDLGMSEYNWTIADLLISLPNVWPDDFGNDNCLRDVGNMGKGISD